MELAGIADRFDVVLSGPHPEQLIAHAADELGVDQLDLEAARQAGAALVIGVARGKSTPEQLRRAGADTVVADLQELLRPT